MVGNGHPGRPPATPRKMSSEQVRAEAGVDECGAAMRALVFRPTRHSEPLLSSSGLSLHRLSPHNSQIAAMRFAIGVAVLSGAGLGAQAALKRQPRSKQGEFLTNAEATRAFAWTATTRSAQEAMEITFPRSAGWANGCFWEGGCREGKVMTQEVVAKWVEGELLGGPDPFVGHGGKVPVPWPSQTDTGDQLGDGQYVGYSRRQVCFIVAKASCLVGGQS